MQNGEIGRENTRGFECPPRTTNSITPSALRFCILHFSFSIFHFPPCLFPGNRSVTGMTTVSDTLRHCVRCGGALPPARSGRVCPRCLAGALLGIPEEPVAEQMIGRFGEYELLSVAGRGGMGVVYRARHARLGREVALKMVASPVLAGESAARRFRAEVEAMAGLDHAHLIPVYEY